MKCNTETNNHWNRNSKESNGSEINVLIQKSQDEIITQISKTHKLLLRQMLFVVSVACSMAGFIGVIFFGNLSGKQIYAGVMYMMMAFMGFFGQVQRKVPYLKKTKVLLEEIQDNAQSEVQNTFFHNIGRYLAQLYELLFFDRRANKLSCEFLDQETSSETVEIEKQLMKSLKNDLYMNLFLGPIYVLTTILTMIFMGDRVNLILSLVLFGLVLFSVIGLITTSIYLQEKLRHWMEGFIKLRSWVTFVENLEIVGESTSNSKEFPTRFEHNICFCANCGETNQEYGTYCQHCGQKIEEQ